MKTAYLARADQLSAVMREADGPVTLEQLYQRAGPCGEWSVRATIVVLNEMRREGLLRVTLNCCILHATFERPLDV